jgi:hypothetical protein
MTKEEFAEHSKRVEDEKNRLRDNKKLRDSMSFDEAIFAAAKPALKAFLAEASALPVYDGTALFNKFHEFCLGQIKEIVDLRICEVLSRPLGSHKTRPGRNKPVISRNNDLLVKRARYLIEELEPSKKLCDVRKRRNSILMTVEEEMNAIDWSGLASSFCKARREQPAS